MPKEPKRKEYVCMRECWHNNHKYKRGQAVMFFEDELPRHVDGTIAHFELIGPDTDVPPPADGPVMVNEEKFPKKK